MPVPRDDEISFIGLLCLVLSPVVVRFLLSRHLRQVTPLCAVPPVAKKITNKRTNLKTTTAPRFIMLFFLTPHARVPPFHEITNAPIRWVNNSVASDGGGLSACIKLRLQFTMPRCVHESSVPVVIVCPVTSHRPRRPQLRD